MIKQFYIIILITLSVNYYGQNNLNDSIYTCFNNRYRDSLIKKGCFFSLDETKYINPDSVIFLSVGNSNLDEFPKQILNFKNVESISFVNSNIAQIELVSPWLLNQEEKHELYKIQKKHPDVREDTHGLFPIPRKNTIKKIPNEIVKLKKLNQLFLNRKYVSKKELKRLKLLLPNCTIVLL
jgi:hypothetical protein